MVKLQSGKSIAEQVRTKWLVMTVVLLVSFSSLGYAQEEYLGKTQRQCISLFKKLHYDSKMYPNRFTDSFDSLLPNMYRWGEEGSGSIQCDSKRRVADFDYGFWQKHNESKDQRRHGRMWKQSIIALEELKEKFGDPKVSGTDSNGWVSYTWKTKRFFYKLTVRRTDDTTETTFDFAGMLRKPMIPFTPAPATELPQFIGLTKSETHSLLRKLHLNYADSAIFFEGKYYLNISLPVFKLWNTKCSGWIDFDSTEHSILFSFDIGVSYERVDESRLRPVLSPPARNTRMQIEHDLTKQFGKSSSSTDCSLGTTYLWKSGDFIYQVNGLELDDNDEHHIVRIVAGKKEILGQ
ncbi:MAG: hypothetical protein Q8916_07020 [Bacteroidota bacterium]|nr:hypothetical protein [Bacteroidota bacterium]